MKKTIITILFLLLSSSCFASYYLLVPTTKTQREFIVGIHGNATITVKENKNPVIRFNKYRSSVEIKLSELPNHKNIDFHSGIIARGSYSESFYVIFECVEGRVSVPLDIKNNNIKTKEVLNDCEDS